MITFTRAAAEEMKERFRAATGRRENEIVTFGTFHAIFFMELKLGVSLHCANIIKEEQKYQFMREIMSKMDLEIRDEGEFISGIT